MEVVLVTGGSGLVGNAIRNEINNSIISGHSVHYSFVFSNSSECNLHIEIKITSVDLHDSYLQFTPLIGKDIEIQNFITNLSESLSLYKRR